MGDRGFEAVMGCSDELDHPVAVLRHGVPLSVVTLSLLRSAKSSNRTRAPARILLSLRRYPDGITGESFFQKDAAEHFPDWLRIVPIFSEHNQAPIRFVVEG